ncbi:MAG: hypothetical protein ACYC9S_07735 [Leptospirales bacterium]
MERFQRFREIFGQGFLLVMGVVFFSVVPVGCSSLESPPNQYGTEHIVAHSEGSRPSWIDRIGEFNKDHPNRRYFVGLSTRSLSIEGGRTSSYANALSNIAGSVKDTVHTLYIQARTSDSTGNSGAYSGDLEQAIESGTLEEANGIITGAEPDRYWWEKAWVQTEPGAPIQYYYNFYVLVSLSKDHYDQTVYQTLNGLGHKVSVPKADRVIETMKNLWLKKPS